MTLTRLLMTGAGALTLLSACETLPAMGAKDDLAKAERVVSDDRLQPILDDHMAMVLEESPTFATTLGVRDYDDRLGDPSLDAYEAGIETRRALLARLDALDGALEGDDALNRKLLALQLRDEIEAAQFGGRYMIITNRGGPHLSLTSLPTRLPFRTQADYESYVARLAAIPDYLDRATGRVRAGIEAGWVQPCASMEGYEDSISVHIVDDPEDSIFLDPFDERPDGVGEAAFASLKSRAAEAVQGDVLPAFREFATFYDNEYQPACRAEVGTSSMPGGEAYYAHRVRLFTTVEDATPDSVHQTGLKEVARIRAEMEEIARGEGYDTLAAFQEYLRTEPSLYPQSPEERMAAASVIAKKMDGKMVELFTVLPRAPYDIKPIPDDIAEKTTTAYYSQPAADGSRPGTYWLNLTKLDTRPLHELEALGLHEAVPGHHHQLALQQELDLPDFRKFGGFTAFVEGWGLYSESLGEEIGFYATPLTKFGQLSYEQWRACRLVVDTGMHAKGWTRQEAIDFMAENSGLSLNNITTEVDRYITWPGQALAYKTGELKIHELRDRAEAALGDRFDKRLFHDAVLENGSVPLSVLEEHIDSWIEEQRSM